MKTKLTLDMIKKINPYYWDTLLEGEEIMWNTLWNFDDLQWNEKNANIVRDCGMILVEVEGLIYVALSGCGMDLQPQIIYTQYKLTDWIESDDLEYLKIRSSSYVEYVIGEDEAKELYEIVKTKQFV